MVIRPTTTYICKTWILNLIEEEILKKWKRKMLRIFGGRRIEEVWSKRINSELEKSYKNLSIVSFVKVQRVRRLEYVETVSKRRMVNLLLGRKSICKRRKDRPRKMCINEVQENLRSLNIK